MLRARLRAMLQAATGLDLAEDAVRRALRARMRALDINDTHVYAQRFDGDAAERNALIDEVVVPESWFLREAPAFDAACGIVQARLARGRPVRILCLPCASGEEPYSLAIRLLEHGVDDALFRIDAADISVAALARARAALYGENAFRGTPAAFRERYFTEEDGGYRLRPQLRALVRFARANLLDPGAVAEAAGPLPALAESARYDIVFCRNLLIYFDAPTQQQAIQRLHALLEDDGILFSGHAEAPTFCSHGFTPAPYPRAFALMRRGERHKESPVSDPVAASAVARLQHADTALSSRSMPANASALSPQRAATRHAEAPRSAERRDSTSRMEKPRPGSRPLRHSLAGGNPERPSDASRTTAQGARAQWNYNLNDAAARPIENSRNNIADATHSLLERGKALADRGRLEEAARVLHRCIELAPESAHAHFMLGLISERLQDPAAAREWLRRAVYLAPDHYEALCHLALLQEQAGEPQPARVLRERAARLFQRRHEAGRA